MKSEVWEHRNDTDTSTWRNILIRVGGKIYIVRFPSIQSVQRFLSEAE